MIISASRQRAGCPVCGVAHSACGPPIADFVAERALDDPKMLVRSKSMADEEQEIPEDRQPLQRYRVQLDGNRGEAVMKLTESHAKRMGPVVLGLADSEQPDHAQVAEEASEPATKAKTPANKSKAASNK